MKKKRKALSLLLSLCMVTSVCPPALADNKTEIEYTEATPQKKQKQVEYTEAVPQKKQKQIEYTDVTTQKKQKYDVTEISSNKKNTNTQDIISNENVVNKETNGTIGIPTTIADGKTFITGTIYDMFDKTVGKTVTVTLYAKGNLDNPLVQCETDSNGVFKFTGISAGEYIIECSSSIFLTQYIGIVLSEDDTNYTVDTIYMQEVGRDNCTVVDADTSAPLENVEVVVYLEGELITSTKTNENGIFSIDGIKRDYYDVMLTCQGYQTKMLEGWLFAAIPTGRTIEMQPSTGDDNPGGDDKGTSGTCGEHLTWILENGTLTISGNGAMYDYASLDDVPWNANDVKKVIIENGVTTVGNSAFYSCMNLTQVTLPDSLVEIRESAFGACVNLPEIVIPEGVTKIAEGAFYSCNNLAKVTIPESVTSIQEGAFGGCSTIKDVYYAGDENQWKNTFIGEDNDFLTNATIHFNSKNTDPDKDDTSGENEKFIWSLDENGTLTLTGKDVTLSADDVYTFLQNAKYIVIKEGVTSIEDYAFQDDSNLMEITILDDIISIDEYAFCNCENLTKVTIPNTVIDIKKGAFEDCINLVNITIPNTVTVINERTFWGCKSLKEIIIPNSVTRIGDSAFLDCSSLTFIEIPASVTSIDHSAFAFCSNLREIIIPNGISNIGVALFQECHSLKKVVIPDSVTKIYNSAFENCNSLTNIVIPDDTIEIGDHAFKGCSSLTNIAIPNGITSIEWGVFEGCSSLAEIVIQNTITSIHNDAFKGCSSLIKIVVPNSVESIGENAFKDCNNLKQCVISNNITCIRKGIFENCNNLTDITIPNGVEWIGDNAFKDCSSLIEVVIPKDVSIMGEHSFEGCINLTNITIPSDIYIYDNSLLGCSSLKRITITDGSTWIPNDDPYSNAFLKCENLTEMFIPDSITQIGDQAFLNPGNLKDIYYAGSEEQWKALITIENTPPDGVIVHFNSTGPDNPNPDQPSVPSKITCDVQVVLDSRNIEYNNGKLRFAGDTKYESKSSFEIPVKVKIKNTSRAVSGQPIKNFDLTVTNININPPNGFNLGWFNGGSINIKNPETIPITETREFSGYMRADTFYDLTSSEAEYTVAITANTNVGEKTAEGVFKVVAKADDSKLSEEAGKELLKLNTKDKVYLAPDVMSVLGLKGKELEAFKKQLLTEVVMSNAPEEVFSEKVTKEVLSKLLGYKEDISVDSYDFPLQYIFNTPRYGTIVLKVTCNVNNFSLTGSKFACNANISYKVVSSQKRLPVSFSHAGTLGMINYADVKAFAKAAYGLAEGVIKNQYNDVWGNTANEVGNLIFGQTVTDILEAADTSYSDIVWDVMTYPTSKKIKNMCPTDVYVYDESGDLCGAIENNEITASSRDFQLSVDGDVKYIDGLEDNYTVKYVATDDGTMDVEITEFWGLDNLIRTVNFYDVPLTVDNEYMQNISEEVTPLVEEYRLMPNTGKDILPDRDSFSSSDEDEPNKPDTPIIPDKPNIPSKPDQPENPDTPAQQFTITFSGNGGIIDDETLKIFTTGKDGKLESLPIPTRTGYTFDGWFSERYDGEKITAETIFTQDTTVYAQWTRNDSSSSGSGGSGGGSSNHKHSSSGSSSNSTARNQKAKVSCTAGGTIIANNDGTVTITPDEGYQVVAISVNGQSTAIPQDGKLTNLKSEDTVIVRFEPISGSTTTAIPFNNSNRFIDVLPGAWYYEAVNYVVAHNLFSGISATKFAPNNTMTRAMLMTVLARMDGQDVTGGSTWYEKGMNWAKQKQISDGTNPQSDITREQLAAMLYRYAGYPATTGNLSQFSDNGQASNYAKSALCWATENGIISGKGNHILDPKGKATRAEVAAMITRFCEMGQF